MLTNTKNGKTRYQWYRTKFLISHVALYHIFRILQILNLKKMIQYSLIHPYHTQCVNVQSSTYRTNLKTQCTAQTRSVRSLFATSEQPHLRDIFINQKIKPLDKLINRQEGILAYKVINGTYLLKDFLNHSDVIVIKSNLDIMVTLEYRHMQPHILNSLFSTEPSMNEIAYQVT